MDDPQTTDGTRAAGPGQPPRETTPTPPLPDAAQPAGGGAPERPSPQLWWDGYRWRAGGEPWATPQAQSGAGAPAQPPGSAAWWWDGYRWQPYPAQWQAAPQYQPQPGYQPAPQYQPAPGYQPPYQPAPAASPAPEARGPSAGRPLFGVTPLARPGQVPWTWRDVLFGLLVAVSPIVALTLLSTVAGGSSSSQPRTTSAALYTVVLTLVVDGWFLLWAWFFSLRKYRLSWRSFGFKGFEEGKAWAIGAGIIIGGLFATYLLSGVNDFVYRKVVGPVPDQNVVTIFPHVPGGLVLFIALAVVIAPVLEETVFRGFVFQGLASSWGPVVGAIVSALIFSLTHQQLSVLFPIFVLGVLLASAFYWTRSIYTNMAFHATFNLLGVLAWWFLK